MFSSYNSLKMCPELHLVNSSRLTVTTCVQQMCIRELQPKVTCIWCSSLVHQCPYNWKYMSGDPKSHCSVRSITKRRRTASPDRLIYHPRRLKEAFKTEMFALVLRNLTRAAVSSSVMTTQSQFSAFLMWFWLKLLDSYYSSLLLACQVTSCHCHSCGKHLTLERGETVVYVDLI